MISSLIDLFYNLMKTEGYHYVGYKRSANQETLIFANEKGECRSLKFGITQAVGHCKNYRVKMSNRQPTDSKVITLKIDFTNTK